MILRIILIAVIVQIYIDGAGFSFEKNIKAMTEKAQYIVKAKMISYVILEDVSLIKDLKNKCGYFDYIETTKILEIYKGKLPNYIMVKRRGEYCGKFHLKQFGISNELVNIIGLDREHDYYLIPDFTYILPAKSDSEEGIKSFLGIASKPAGNTKK